ncbi:hypothetical protein AB9128_14230 [Streptomyces cinereoruber]
MIHAPLGELPGLLVEQAHVLGSDGLLLVPFTRLLHDPAPRKGYDG